MLNSKNGKNVIKFDLISKDKNFFYNEILLVYYQLSENCIITEVTELI